jgi:hypothetical protein
MPRRILQNHRAMVQDELRKAAGPLLDTQDQDELKVES